MRQKQDFIRCLAFGVGLHLIIYTFQGSLGAITEYIFTAMAF